MSPLYVIEPPAIPSLPVAGDTRRFPVNRIYCVGRNYAEHAREMGHDPEREPPFFFMKPATAIVADGNDMQYPEQSEDVQYEVELVVAIGMGGTNIQTIQALEHVYGYGVGLDMTRRDLQTAAKKMGRPWDTGKAFDQSAPCATITPISQCGHIHQGLIQLSVNGEVRQTGNIDHMIWSIPEIIAHLSTVFRLESGDLIFSGTPAGVGSVKRGDILNGSVTGLSPLILTIV
jgi:fumarylpyruvate hydrolase